MPLKCVVEKREMVSESLRAEEEMASYDVLGPGGRVVLHAQTPFVQSDVKRHLFSVRKHTNSGAEVTFGSKGSWIDLHTDSGSQRVPVRVKGKTFGLSIPKTSGWIIPQADEAPLDEEMGREAEPNLPPAAPEALAAPRAEQTQGMRLEREARDLAAAWQSSRQFGRPLGEGGLSG